MEPSSYTSYGSYSSYVLSAAAAAATHSPPPITAHPMYPFGESALFEEFTVERLELPVQQIIRLMDQADHHICRNTR